MLYIETGNLRDCSRVLQIDSPISIKENKYPYCIKQDTRPTFAGLSTTCHLNSGYVWCQWLDQYSGTTKYYSHNYMFYANI